MRIIRHCFCPAARHPPVGMSQEESSSETNRPAPSPQPAVRRHRGHRGGRGRGPRRSGPASPPALPEDAPPETAAVPGQKASARTPDRSGASAISHAVNEVMQIVESLKQALRQMEEVLELVEHAERQKLADEHEIDSLRRLLRQLQHPRSSGGERRE